MNTLCGNSESAQENICLEWADVNKQMRDRPSDSEETTIFDPDYDSKIKPEIELKEDTDNFVYKADFSGHLQLVSIAQSISNHSSSAETAQQDPLSQCPSMKSDLNSCTDEQHVVLSWQGQTNCNPTYKQLKSVSDGSLSDRCFIKEEPSENNPHGCSYIHTLPEIYDYSSDSTWDPQTDGSSQLRISSSLSLSSNLLLTQAEKKRLYRLRIKEENPALWSSLKKREAARKREQREKRRHVLFEMQKAMERADRPDSPDGANQRMYLEALKERYPELWNQLMDALPTTQMRNDQLFNERTTKSRRNVPKQAKMYRDVIEAQKKRLYRQRIKEERPEMYARQKARDAYSRSVQRHIMKKVQKNAFQVESNMNSLNADACAGDSSFSDVAPTCISGSEVPCVPAKSVPSQVCDNNPSEDVYTFRSSPVSSDNNISELDLTQNSVQSNRGSNAFSTQSNILWMWNDLGSSSEKASSVPYTARRSAQALTEEERLQKILRERLHMREKRRQYRLGMTPEKRMEFLDLERERLRVYRLRKKAAAENLMRNGER